MKLELTKTIILAILVGTSVLLSSVLWNITPQYSPAQQLTGNMPLADRVASNRVKTMAEVVLPHQIVISQQEVEQNKSSMIIDKSNTSYNSTWLLFRKAVPQQNFIKTNKNENQNYQVKLTAVLKGKLPFAVINQTLFATERDREFNDLLIEKINIVVEQNYQEAVIQYEGKDFYLEANTVLTVQEILDLVARVNEVKVAQKQRVEMKRLRHEEQHYIQFYFSNPLTVRQIAGVGNSNIYTDGSKGLRVQAEQSVMEYSQPSIVQGREAVNYSKMLNEALLFMSKLPAWQTNYTLVEMQRVSEADNEFRLLFQAVHNNNLIVTAKEDSMIATIELRMQDNTVSRLIRSTDYIGEQIASSNVSVISRQEMNELIERRFSLQLNDYILFEAYKSKMQTNELQLIPVWIMINDDVRAVFDANTGQQLQ